MKSYLFAMNGAAIKMWDGPHGFERAMAQARQWKANNPEKRIVVEEFVYDYGTGYRNTGCNVAIEFPTLVPELTRKHDFDYLPALAEMGA